MSERNLLFSPMVEKNLRSHYLFAALKEPQWQRLLPHVHVLKLPEGRELFEQNQVAEAFYVVCSGDMKLYRNTPEGLEKIMRLVRSGQSFAESVLFSEPPRYPVHAQAASSSLLAAVEREAYLEVLRESFDTCRAVMAQMVTRIRAHWDEIEMLSMHSSRARVARYLFGLLPDNAVAGTRLRLPARKALIAGRLGLAPETLSRALRALSDAGTIAVHGPQIEVRDVASLLKTAQQ